LGRIGLRLRFNLAYWTLILDETVNPVFHESLSEEANISVCMWL